MAWQLVLGWVATVLETARAEDLELCEYLLEPEAGPPPLLYSKLKLLPTVPTVPTIPTVPKPPAPIKLSIKPVEPPELSVTPQADAYWQIVFGNSLIGVVRTAYGYPNGDARTMDAVRGVVRHPFNAPYLVDPFE